MKKSMKYLKKTILFGVLATCIFSSYANAESINNRGLSTIVYGYVTELAVLNDNSGDCFIETSSKPYDKVNKSFGRWDCRTTQGNHFYDLAKLSILNSYELKIGYKSDSNGQTIIDEITLKIPLTNPGDG